MALAVGAISLPSVGRAAPPSIAPARFVLRGTARAELTAFPAREVPVDVLALVAPGTEPGVVRLHLRSRGQGCELRARLSGPERLVLEAGQVCTVELARDVEGDVTGRLRSGSGRLTARELTLELTWSVSGSVRSVRGARIVIPGTSTELALPAIAAVPVQGTVRADVSGRVDDTVSGG